MRTTRYITLCIILLLCSIAVPLQGNAIKEFTTTITFQVNEGEQVQTIGLRNNEEFSSAIVREHTKIIIGDATNNATYVTWNEDVRNTSEEKIYFKPYYIEKQKQKENIFLRFFVPQQYIQDNTTIETHSLTLEITTVIETDNYLYGRLPALIPTDDVTVQPQETIEYLIITNTTFFNITKNNYNSWKTNNDNKVNTIRLVNISDIQANDYVWVNGTYGDATNSTNGNPWIPDGKEITTNYNIFNDTQCHIRNYIRYMADTYNTTYILLLGNKDVVPPRLVEMHAHSGPTGSWYNSTPKPSDLYYSNLDYSMNNNTNSEWLECRFDGFYWIRNGSGLAEYDEIDWTYDVIVGRALINTKQELWNWINKTKAYHNGLYQGNYLRNGIVATRDNSNNIDDGVWNVIGDEFAQNITFLNGQNISNTQHNNIHHYCNGFYDGWDGFNMMHHAGHSGTHSGTLWDEYRPALQNNTALPNFVYSEGCHAGNFGASESCIEDWIQDDACMFAGVANSCWGWFTASTWYGEEMFSIMFNETTGVLERNFAKAHIQSKEEVPPSTHPVCPMIIKETNFFGDPALEYQWYRPAVVTNTTTNINITNGKLNAYVINAGGNNCTVWFEYGLTDSYGNKTANQTKTTGEQFSHIITELQSNTTYHVRAVAQNDNGSSFGDDYTFNTTSNSPPFTPQDCTVESMTGFGDGYCSVYDTYLNATVSDPDGDTVNVSYYLNGVKVNEMSDVTNGSAVSLCVSNISNASYWDNGTFEPRNILNHTSTYSWYVEVDDGIDIETSATQYFTTSEPWDLIEDGDMNLDDITQALVVDWYYIDEPTEVGGKIPSDINDDGYIDLNDLSLFSSHWYDDTWYE